MKFLRHLIALLTAGTAAANSNWVPAPERNLTIYVGWPLEEPKEWKEVKTYDRERLVLVGGGSVPAVEVRSYLLVYPNREVLTGANVFYPLPAVVTLLEPRDGLRPPIPLDPEQMKYGGTLCQVSNSAFRRDPQGKAIYATTLKNLSKQRIRIEKFIAVRQVNGVYLASTVSGSYYTAEQFTAWYAVPADGWIPAGGSVADESNYGSGDGLWAYFGRTEEGRPFIVTCPVPR